jgi:hypothetical protein
MRQSHGSPLSSNQDTGPELIQEVAPPGHRGDQERPDLLTANQLGALGGLVVQIRRDGTGQVFLTEEMRPSPQMGRTKPNQKTAVKVMVNYFQ